MRALQAARIVLPLTALAVAALAPAAPAQQENLAPGPGRVAAGAAALLEPDLPPGSGSLKAESSRFWFSLSRPWGVPDVQQGEIAWRDRPGGPTWTGAWRQIEGDGLVQRYLELGREYPMSPGEGVGLGWGVAIGVHRLAGGGMRPLTRGVGRAGVVVQVVGGLQCAWWEQVPAAGLRGGGWYRQHRRREWAAGWLGDRLEVAAGESVTGTGRREPALKAAWSHGPTRVVAGWWGDPPVPGLGLWLRTGAVRWQVEIRGAPGLGLLTFWTIACGQPARP